MSHTLHTATVQFAGLTVKCTQILLVFLVDILIHLMHYPAPVNIFAETGTRYLVHPYWFG